MTLLNMTPDIFFSEFSIQFPKVASGFELEDGDHYKVGLFVDYTIEQIEQKNIVELKKCFEFIESRLGSITPEIENALNVSYCEALIWYDDHKRGIEMKEIMPVRLLRFYLAYKKYYNSLS